MVGLLPLCASTILPLEGVPIDVESHDFR